MQAIMETLFDIVYDAPKPVDQCPSTFILGYLPKYSLCSLGTVNNHSVLQNSFTKEGYIV